MMPNRAARSVRCETVRANTRPAPLVELLLVPFCDMARAWKASNCGNLSIPFVLYYCDRILTVLLPDSTAFAEKTMPFPQWPVCAQNTQIGAESLTWTVYVGKVVAFPATGMKPESKPT